MVQLSHAGNREQESQGLLRSIDFIAVQRRKIAIDGHIMQAFTG
jgi:hypothetical protein